MTHDPFGVCLEPECHDSSEKELPSVADMAKGFLDSAKDVLMGVVQNEGVIVTDEIYNNWKKESPKIEKARVKLIKDYKNNLAKK